MQQKRQLGVQNKGMMLKTKVKASRVSNLTDARYFAACEVQWIGFNLEQGTEQYIAPQKMRDIRGWLEGPEIVGEFGLLDAATIRETATFLELDAVQLSHFADLQTAKALADIPLLKEIVVSSDVDAQEIAATMRDFAPLVRAFLLDFSKNGITWDDLKNEQSIGITTLKAWCANFNLILHLDFSPDNVAEILALSPWGINLVGGEEEKVGYKSFDAIDEIIECLEIDA